MKKYRLGERLSFTTWKKLLTKALALSCDGYGVAVIGFEDMSENVLTITALPERSN